MKTDDIRLNGEQVGGLVKLLRLTQDHEITCGEFLQHVGEYADHRLEGTALEEVKAGVEHHLAICPECHEEYRALLKILEAQG